MRIRGNSKGRKSSLNEMLHPLSVISGQPEAGLFHAGLHPHAHVADLAVVEPVVDPVAGRQQAAGGRGLVVGIPAEHIVATHVVSRVSLTDS